jgi:PAS domain-containing protein
MRSPRLYRSQALAMVVGMLAPAIATLLITFRVCTGWTGIPPAIGLTISGLAFAWAIFRYRLFDLVPIAREKLIDGMDDGMLVLDDQQRVVDLNPAMARLLDIPTGRAVAA